jgi:PIN domain nuclease of toxin-antitoxin system
MNILLDTCTFLWLASSPKNLSDSAVSLIDAPSNQLYLSDVSIWEIVLKYTTGKLPLPEPPRIWIPKQSVFFQLTSLSINSEALFRSGEIPPLHRDPFDRLLAAQGIVHGLTILTPDSPFADLGATTHW